MRAAPSTQRLVELSVRGPGCCQQVPGTSTSSGRNEPETRERISPERGPHDQRGTSNLLQANDTILFCNLGRNSRPAKSHSAPMSRRGPPSRLLLPSPKANLPSRDRDLCAVDAPGYRIYSLSGSFRIFFSSGFGIKECCIPEDRSRARFVSRISKSSPISHVATTFRHPWTRHKRKAIDNPQTARAAWCGTATMMSQWTYGQYLH